MRIVIETDETARTGTERSEPSVEVVGGRTGDPSERQSTDGPADDPFDRSEARDAGGPPPGMIGPDDRRTGDESTEADEAWPPTEERPDEGLYSGGSFQGRR
jgi:hypothetical protein